jgi:predicted nucleic acid-binding protein
VIYLDSSVALAHLFAEARRPPSEIWTRRIVSSRLFEYEITIRMHARRLGKADFAAARTLIDGMDLLDLSVGILSRALAPFPLPVRTLDALHLATMDFLRANGLTFEVATYDGRLAASAEALGFTLADV